MNTQNTQKKRSTKELIPLTEEIKNHYNYLTLSQFKNIYSCGEYEMNQLRFFHKGTCADAWDLNCETDCEILHNIFMRSKCNHIPNTKEKNKHQLNKLKKSYFKSLDKLEGQIQRGKKLTTVEQKCWICYILALLDLGVKNDDNFGEFHMRMGCLPDDNAVMLCEGVEQSVMGELLKIYTSNLYTPKNNEMKGRRGGRRNGGGRSKYVKQRRI